MAVACIILVVIAVLGIGLAFYYRRQIKNVKNHNLNRIRVINRQRVGRTPEWFYNGKCDK